MTYFFMGAFSFPLSDVKLYQVLRARHHEKELKVKPATSFKYFQYLLTKNKTKFKTEKI